MGTSHLLTMRMFSCSCSPSAWCSSVRTAQLAWNARLRTCNNTSHQHSVAVRPTSFGWEADTMHDTAAVRPTEQNHTASLEDQQTPAVVIRSRDPNSYTLKDSGNHTLLSAALSSAGAMYRSATSASRAACSFLSTARASLTSADNPASASAPALSCEEGRAGEQGAGQKGSTSVCGVRQCRSEGGHKCSA